MSQVWRSIAVGVRSSVGEAAEAVHVLGCTKAAVTKL